LLRQRHDIKATGRAKRVNDSPSWHARSLHSPSLPTRPEERTP
jgi:hypothetical protein